MEIKIVSYIGLIFNRYKSQIADVRGDPESLARFSNADSGKGVKVFHPQPEQANANH